MYYKRMVARGYDAIAERLASHAYQSDHVRRWLEELAGALAPGSRVLDLGCGSGAPHTGWLASRFQVIGVDISRRQLELAQRHSPGAAFIHGDMTALTFPPSCFDAVVALYSIIHVPRQEHPLVLRCVYEWLRPGGRALVVLGGGDSPAGIEADWFGAPMYWSHYDSDRSLELLRAAGFEIVAASREADMIDTESGGSEVGSGVDKPPGQGPCHLFALGRKAQC